MNKKPISCDLERIELFLQHKLTDFGLARAADDASLTRTGIIAGTPQYMSPEQARGESVGQKSDLFSLGSVLYAMCSDGLFTSRDCCWSHSNAVN